MRHKFFPLEKSITDRSVILKFWRTFSYNNDKSGNMQNRNKNNSCRTKTDKLTYTQKWRFAHHMHKWYVRLYIKRNQERYWKREKRVCFVHINIGKLPVDIQKLIILIYRVSTTLALYIWYCFVQDHIILVISDAWFFILNNCFIFF